MHEVAALKEKLQQAQDINGKQQAAIGDLQDVLGRLQIEQQEQSFNHKQAIEALVKSEQEAAKAAAKVCVNSLALAAIVRDVVSARLKQTR